jgi:hemerythrin-like domain-containing protein
MKITDALRAEHLVFHNMFDHVEKIAPKIKTLAEARAVAALVDTLMRSHSNTEDDLFIGPLEHCFEQIGQQETFHKEHEELHEMLANVQKAKAIKKARELLLTIVVSSRSHFDKEERIVFPMAERILKSKTLNELGQTWMDQRKGVAT